MRVLVSRTSGRTVRGDAPGFTLVELLVVVGIVALLVAILLPTLTSARSSARDGVCLRNLRTLSSAWIAYTARYDRFPTDGKSPSDDPPYGNRWGGEQAYNNPNNQETVRLIHEFLGLSGVIKHKFEVFHCPKDTNAIYAGDPAVNLFPAGRPVWEGLPPSFFDRYRNDDFRDSVFAMQGNSYGSNDWVWAEIGSIDGAGGASQAGRHWKHDLPLGAIINPGMTLMLGDVPALHAGPLTPSQQIEIGAWIGWWHGLNETNAAFWDGSAKRVRMKPGGYTNEYWLWLQPQLHDPTGTPIARLPTVRNPLAPPAN